MSVIRAFVAVVTLGVIGGAVAIGATLTVGGVTLGAGQTGEIVVSGVIDAEPSYGVTILLQIVPRAGNTGTLQFTPAPPTDIAQRGDPWPGEGIFSPFDTDQTASPSQNGSADDNGALAEITSFSGALTAFPVTASQDADGVWDVLLSIPGVDSTWWDAPNTTLVAGTVTVLPDTPIPTVSTWGLVTLSLLLSAGGTLVHTYRLRRRPQGYNSVCDGAPQRTEPRL